MFYERDLILYLYTQYTKLLILSGEPNCRKKWLHGKIHPLTIVIFDHKTESIYHHDITHWCAFFASFFLKQEMVSETCRANTHA